MRKYFLLSVIVIFILASCVSGTEVVVSTVTTSPTHATEVVQVDRLALPEQPVWMKDQKSNVLLMNIGVFIDPFTADTLFLMGQNVRWIDNNHVGFNPQDDMDCESGKAYQYVLDLSKWKMTDQPSDHLACLLKLTEDPNLDLGWNEKGRPVKIYNEVTGQWVSFLYPPEGLYNHKLIFAVGKIFLVQGDDSFENGYLVAVYDFETKQLLRRFYGKVDGNIIRYASGKVFYATEGTLCLVDVNDLIRNCEKMFSDEFGDVKIGQPLEDGSVLPFLYFKKELENGSTNNLCFLEISTKILTCLTEGISDLAPEIMVLPDITSPSGTRSELQSKSIFSYSVSPDKRFVIFCYGNVAYSKYMGTVVIDAITKNYHKLDDVEFVPDIISYSCEKSNSARLPFSWRPLP